MRLGHRSLRMTALLFSEIRTQDVICLLLPDAVHARIGQAHQALAAENVVDFVIGDDGEGLADLESDQVALAIGVDDLAEPLSMGSRVRPADHAVIF